MTAAIAALQNAVFQRLATDGPLTVLLDGYPRIFDRAPSRTPLPYVVIGETSVYDWSTDSDSGTEHLLTLQVWSDEKFDGRAPAIMRRLHTLLHDADLQVEGHHLVSIRVEQSALRYANDYRLRNGTMHLRARIEALEPGGTTS